MNHISKSRKSHVVVFIALMAVFMLMVSAVHSQEATPTLGPTKSATPEGVEPEPTPTAPPDETEPPAVIDTTTFMEPLTQADLNVLTGNVQRPNGIGWFEGNLYTACTGDQTIYEIDDTTGATMTYIYGIVNAHMLHVERDELDRLTMWVPDYGANELRRVSRNGVVEVADGLEGPWGITYYDEESFLITNLMGNYLTRVTRDGDVQRLLEGLASPTGIALDEEYVYVANNGSTRRAVESYAIDQVIAGTASSEDGSATLVRGIQNTSGLVMGPDGLLYFAYSLGTRGVVGRVNPAVCRENGGCTNEQIEIVAYTELEAPIAGLVVTPDMRLYMHTMFAPDIYWVQL